MGASGFYPSTSDPVELRRAVTEQARAQERNILTFEQHMKIFDRLEKNLLSLADSNAKLTIKLTRLQTKMAIYASLGAGAGGAVTALVSRLFQ